MSKPLVIFGLGEAGELAHHYFSNDSSYRVAAFTVDRAFAGGKPFAGLPVVPFEDLPAACPPATHDLFVAVGYSGVNALRKEKYLAARTLGYATPSYVSSRATILNGGRIGANCFILEDAVVQPFATIGNNVTLWSGSHVGHHSTIGDHVFIAPRVAIPGCVEIGESCFLGANCTLRDHIRVGERCVIGAGALLLEDAEPGGVYIGSATERSDLPSSKLRKI